MVPLDRLSRFLSFLLRHRPPDYPLAFDRQGFVPWTELVARVKTRFPDATDEDIRGIVAGSDKQRFELRGDRVRATYGHSFAVDLGGESIAPPDELYYGTARDLAQGVLREGLKPRGRAYVHLSAAVDDAIAVGRKRDPIPAVIVVDARSAHESGVEFYSSGPLFLAPAIPPEFLSLRKEQSTTG
jgi:putative RNA 2'-phosphotransferase